MNASYYVRYWRADGGLMLGAVKRSETSRFETAELAKLRFAGIVDAHAGTSGEGLIRGELVPSNRPAQITLQDSGREVRELVGDAERFSSMFADYEHMLAINK